MSSPKNENSSPKDALSRVSLDFGSENEDEGLEEFYPASPLSEFSADLYDEKTEEIEEEEEHSELEGSELEKGLFEKTLKDVDENKAKLDDLKVPQKDLEMMRRKKLVVAKPKRPLIPNTYRKTSVNSFDAEIVHSVVHLVLQRYLHPEYRYPKRPSKANKKALQMSAIIRDTIKKFRFERFKTACLLELIEKPKLDETSTCETPSFMSGYIVLHDTRRDKVVTSTWESKYLVCSCVVFGFYVE